MSSVNVTGITKDQFGTKMPNPFIERVTLNFTQPKEDFGGGLDTEIKVNLSIKFTKPDYLQSGTAKDFVEKQLSNVFLYCYLTQEDWIKEKLDSGMFSIEYWHKIGMHRLGPYYGSGGRYVKIPLLDLVAKDNKYDSLLHIGPNFDQTGNEIVQINNINITMDTSRFGDDPTDGGPRFPSLEEIENLMFFTYIGLSAKGSYDRGIDDPLAPVRDELDGGLFGERYGEDEFLSGVDLTTKFSSNAYFSDISYYHILNKNRIATKFFQAYVRPDGMPYFDKVLQSTNGKFYTTDNYSFDDIKTSIEALIEIHNASREADASLDTNIKNLEAIINASGNKTGVLTQLSNYRATYPDKSPTGLSGTFYAEFVVVFAEILQSVQDQEALDTRRLYDSLVVDNRYSFSVGVYTPPDPSALVAATPTSGIVLSDVKRGIPYESPSSCYIPKKWFMMARKAYMTDSIDSYTDEDLMSLYGTSEDDFRERFSDESDTLSKLLADLEQKYFDEGFTSSEARHMAREELSYDFDTAGVSASSRETTGERTVDTGRTRSRLLNATLNSGPDSAGGGSSYVSLRAGDAVVKNMGIFFFDYEKALRTQSMIAHVLDIEKLQQLFRINIPYENFFVKNVELSRNELRLDATDIESYHDKFIRTKLHLEMCTPSSAIRDPLEDSGTDLEYIDYPKNKKIRFKYLGGKDSGEAESTSEIYAQRVKYLRPSYKMGGSNYVSTLKFVNWDRPVREDQLLKNINKLDDVVANKNLDFTSITGRDSDDHLRVYDGYRLMCFSFSDVADDDIAFYNTMDIEDEERSALLETSNNLGERRSCYSITVEVEDQTQLAYDNFASYIVGVYNEFAEYYGYANDICSFNNITNEFNQFFIDQIEEIFPDSTTWIKSAYVANALGELLFGITGTKIDTAVFNEKVQETVIKISPRTGNLFQLTAFAEQFKAAVDYIIINDLETSSGVGVGTGVLTPFNRMREIFPSDGGDDIYRRRLQFYNEKPIWEPVSGDITPDDLTLSDTSADMSYMALPEFAIPIDGMDPIATDYDTSMSTAAAAAIGVLVGGIPTDSIYTDYYGTGVVGADFSLGVVSEGPTDYRDDISLATTVGNAGKVVDLVYLPRTSTGGLSFNYHLAWFGLDMYISTFGAHDPMSTADFREMLTLKDKYYVIKDADIPESAPTSAAYFLNKIIQYTTIDVDVESLDKVDKPSIERGRLRPGIEPFSAFSAEVSPVTAMIANRRSYRNVINCLAVLERFRQAHNYYYTGTVRDLPGTTTIDHHEGNIHFMSSNYATEATFFSGYLEFGAGYTEAMAEPTGVETSASMPLKEIHRRFIRRSYYVTDLLKTILASVATAAAAGDTAGAISILEEYGLASFMNPDDPFGPLSGTLGRDSSNYDASTIDVHVLISS